MADREELDPRLDFVFEIIKERCETQLRWVDATDTKAGLMIGAIGVVAAATLGAGAETLARYELWQLIVLVTLLVASLMTAIGAYWTRRWRVDPEPRPFYRKYSARSLEDTKRQLVSNYVASFEANRPVCAKKLMALQCSFVLFTAAATWALFIFLCACGQG